jgi:hypothetical protein
VAKWSWRKAIAWAIKTLFLFLALFIAGDELYASLSPLAIPSKLSEPIRWDALSQAFNTVPSATPVTSSEDRIAYWSNLLNAGDPPLTRTVTISATAESVVLDMALWLPKTHSLAERTVAGELDAFFSHAAFGEIFISPGQVGLDYDQPDWTVDAGTETIRIHARFISPLDGKTTILIQRQGIVGVVVPVQDDVILEFENLVLIQFIPIPDQVTDRNAFLRQSNPRSNSNISFTLAPIRGSSSLSQNNPGTSRQLSESQQAFLKRLGGLIDIPLLSPLIFSLVEALPFLLFLYFVERKYPNLLRQLLMPNRATRLHFPVSLARTLISLLIFHFVLYLLSGIGNLSYKIGFINQLGEQIWRLGYALGLERIPFILGGAPYRIAPVFLGVVMPAVLLCWSNPTWFRAKRRTVRWLVIPVLLLFLSPFMIVLGLRLTKGLNLATLPIVGWLLVVSGIAAWFIWVILIALHRQLSQETPRFDVVTLAIILFIAIHAIDFYLQGLTKESTGMSWVWLVVTTVLGANLLLAFIGLVCFFIQNIAWHWILSRRVRWLLVAMAILLAIPLNSIVKATNPISSESDILNLAYQLDNLILFLWLAGVLWWLFHVGKHDQKIDAFTRTVGILAISSIFFGSTARWLYLPIPFLLGWFLLSHFVQPATHWYKLEPLFKPVFQKRVELLNRILELNAAEKAYIDLRKKLGEKLTTNELSLGKYHLKLQQYRSDLNKRQTRAQIKKRPIRDVALEFGPYDSAWMNGLHGAKFALLFAIPWIALSIRSLFTISMSNWEPYPMWNMGIDVLTLVVKWISLGFFLGYFYPYLRGKNGLQKGVGLFLVAVLPSLPLMGIYNASLADWQAGLLWILQVFIECMLLGLVAFDYVILRQGRYDWQMLFEVHGITSVGLSVSTIVAAIGVALTTLLTTQATNLIALALTFIIPQVPPDIIPK